jgi:hypothetical protein
MMSDRVDKKTSGAVNGKNGKNGKNGGATDGYWSDTTYDVLGWVTLVAIGFGIAALSK